MKRKEWQQIFRSLGLLSHIGLTIIASIGVAFFLGQYLDRLLGFSFLLTPIFSILGIGAGFLSVHKLIRNSVDDPKKDD